MSWFLKGMKQYDTLISVGEQEGKSIGCLIFLVFYSVSYSIR